MIRGQRSLSPEPQPSRKEDGAQFMNSGEYWSEATELHRPRKRGASMTDLASVPDIIPLDVLFTICSEKHGWLTIKDKKVTVNRPLFWSLLDNTICLVSSFE